MGPEIVEYLRRIDATLEPYEGRFLVHGGTITPVEGEWPGTLVVVGFPSREHAEAWYASDAYQEILPLRTNNAEGSTIIVDGVPPGYSATAQIPRAA